MYFMIFILLLYFGIMDVYIVRDNVVYDEFSNTYRADDNFSNVRNSSVTIPPAIKIWINLPIYLFTVVFVFVETIYLVLIFSLKEVVEEFDDKIVGCFNCRCVREVILK